MEFFVSGKPQGKARPRFSRRSGHTYTPQKTVDYESRIREAFLEAGGEKLERNCYVSVSVTAYFPIPQSWPKIKRAWAEERIIEPGVKPDADNILKAVLDALNGVAYEDDSQVILVKVWKTYSTTPGLRITVGEHKE